MNGAPREVPRIVVFPPLIPALALLVSVALQWLYPLGLFHAIGTVIRRAIGLGVLIAGLAILVAGLRSLVQNGTNVQPSRPALRLVTDGIFAWSRNPMYLGGSTALLGEAFLARLDWLPLLLVASFAILHVGIVMPEEAYLEGRFGAAFSDYKRRVPRYLGPF